MDAHRPNVYTPLVHTEFALLSIRDREVRSLAEAVMKARGAPNLTAAIKLALQNEVERAERAVPLRERIAALRAEALAMADRPPLPALTDDERDSLWTG